MKVKATFPFSLPFHISSSHFPKHCLVKKLLCKYWAETHTWERHAEELFENMPKNPPPATQTSWSGFREKSGKWTLGGKLKGAGIFPLGRNTSEKGVLKWF